MSKRLICRTRLLDVPGLLLALLMLWTLSTADSQAAERPSRGQIVYEGTYTGRAGEGFMFLGGSDIEGAITLTVNFDGDALRASYKTTGPLSGASVSGLVSGNSCRLTGRRNLSIEGECTATTFIGKLVHQPVSTRKTTVDLRLTVRAETSSSSADPTIGKGRELSGSRVASATKAEELNSSETQSPSGQTPSSEPQNSLPSQEHSHASAPPREVSSETTRTPNQPGVFRTNARSKTVLLRESTGERLEVELSCHGKCSVQAIDWGTRRCAGFRGPYRTYQSRVSGQFTIWEAFQNRGGCSRKCTIVLEKGLGKYTRVCGKQTVATGRFDDAINIELLGDLADRSSFFTDPVSIQASASIPPGPWRLEDDSAQYKEAHAAIPSLVQESVMRGAVPADFRRLARDVADSIVEVDSKGWGLNTYIPGSLREVQITEEAGSTRIAGQLTYLSFQYRSWQTGSVVIDIANNKVECIRYWNNRSCSANFERIVNPTADRSLPERDAKCLRFGTAQADFLKGDSMAAICTPAQIESGFCVDRLPAPNQEHTTIENTCSNEVNLVLVCPLLRQRMSIPAQRTVSIHGFRNLGCSFERGRQ